MKPFKITALSTEPSGFVAKGKDCFPNTFFKILGAIRAGSMILCSLTDDFTSSSRPFFQYMNCILNIFSDIEIPLVKYDQNMSHIYHIGKRKDLCGVRAAALRLLDL